MPRLFCVIPTRERPVEVVAQVERLLPQLADGERVIVAHDGYGAVPAMPADSRLTQLVLKERVGVDTARRMATALVPSDGIVVELDDHDPVEPNLLEEVRAAFMDRRVKIAYCDCWISDPAGQVKKQKEKAEGEFRDHGNLGLGMRAYRKWIYDAVGGYPFEHFPANDFALLCMMDQLTHFQARKRIPKPLVTVIIDSRGISAKHKTEQEQAVCRICDIANNGGFTFDWRFVPGAAAEPSQPAGEVETVGAVAFEAAATQVAGVKRRPRVLLMTKIIGVGRGGGELSMLAMLRQAHALGYDVCGLYTKDAGETPSVPEWMAARRLEATDWENPDRLTEAALDAKPDVIVTEVRTAPLAIRVSERTGIPVVTMVQFWHNIVETDEGGLTAVQQRPVPDGHWHPNRELLAKSAGFIANSEFTAEVVQQAFGRSPTSIVYPPIDLARVLPEDAVPVRERSYIVCPSVQEGKGSLIFLQLAKRNPGLKFLLLAGDDRHSREDNVLKFAESLENVTVRRDWVTDMREVYRDCRLMFIGTQTAESFCRAAAESIAGAIPLLVSDAGNLPRLVQPERGVVVPRHADLDEWNAGLHKALEMAPTGNPMFCNAEAGGFKAALDAHRKLSEVAMLVPQAAGISVGAAQFREVCGIDLLNWECGPGSLDPYSLVISAGAHRPDLSDACKGRMAYWWCSHFTQMDTSRHEMRGLLDVLDELKGRGDRYLFLTSEASAQALARLTRCDRVKWLPNVYALKPFQAPEKLLGRHVWLIGPYVTRKNVFAALAAAALADAEIHASAWLRMQCEEAVRLADTLGVPLHLHDCPNAEAVAAAASKCGAAIALSTAETYCLAAVQCIEVGTPVVGWPGIPALCESPTELMVDDPADVVAAKAALNHALGGQWTKQQSAVVAGTIARLNARARATLMEVLA